MGRLSSVLRSQEGDRLAFFCPGCKNSHSIRIGDGPGPRWSYNGNAEAPTFGPSILVTGRDFTEAGEAAFEQWHKSGCPKPAPEFESRDVRCHSFVVDGRIQFLADCTHGLAGQTVELPDIETTGQDA